MVEVIENLQKQAKELETKIAALALTHEEKKQAAEDIRQTQRQKEREIEGLERDWFERLSEAKEAADEHNNLMAQLTNLDGQIAKVDFEMKVEREKEKYAKPFLTALRLQIEEHFANRATSVFNFEDPVTIDDLMEEFEACMGFQGTRGGLGQAVRAAERDYNHTIETFFQAKVKGKNEEADRANNTAKNGLTRLLSNQFVKEIIDGERAIS